MKITNAPIVGVLLLFCQTLYGQTNYLDEVHLMQNFFRDASVAYRTYGEGRLQYNDFNNANTINIGAQGGSPIGSQLELQAAWSFISVDPNVGTGNSGLSDIYVGAKYHLPKRTTKARFSLGGFLTLPVGDNNIGQGNVNLGGFGALRYPVSIATVITGIGGLNIIDTGNNRDLSLSLGGGIIHQVGRMTHIVGELNIETLTDFSAISGGIDYALLSGSRLRGMLAIGLDNGAPDISLQGSFFFSF